MSEDYRSVVLLIPQCDSRHDSVPLIYVLLPLHSALKLNALSLRGLPHSFSLSHGPFSISFPTEKTKDIELMVRHCLP